VNNKLNEILRAYLMDLGNLREGKFKVVDEILRVLKVRMRI
jgi:hypothetical protein